MLSVVCKYLNCRSLCERLTRLSFRTVLYDTKHDLLDQCRIFEALSLAVNNLKAVSVVVPTAHPNTGRQCALGQVSYAVHCAAINIHGSKPHTYVNYFGLDVVHTMKGQV